MPDCRGVRIFMLAWLTPLLLLYGQFVKCDEQLMVDQVHALTETIIDEIQRLNETQGVSGSSHVPGVQVSKLSIHAFGKSLELQEKVARAQLRLGMNPLLLGSLPLRDIDAEDVRALLVTVLAEIRRISAAVGIGENLPQRSTRNGSSMSDVYENLWRASYAMDGLSGEILPANVYRNTQYIQQDIESIARHRGLVLVRPEIELVDGKIPLDANIAGYKNLYRVSWLCRRIGVKPPRVPSFPVGKITPSDVYDTTNMLLTELARVKIHLAIDNQRTDLTEQSDITPSHVVMEMKKIGVSLEQLLSGA